MHDTDVRTIARINRSSPLIRPGDETYPAPSLAVGACLDRPRRPCPSRKPARPPTHPIRWGPPGCTVVDRVVPAWACRRLAAGGDPCRARRRSRVHGAAARLPVRGGRMEPGGRAPQGHLARNNAVPLPQRPGRVDVYVEAAGNPDVPSNGFTRPTRLGAKETAGSVPMYVLRAMDVALLDECVYELVQDVVGFRGMVDVLPAASPRRTRCCGRWSGCATSSTLTRSAKRPRLVARPLPGCSRPRRPPARTWSTPWVTRTSTPRGCGRSARRSARWRARSRTSWRSWTPTTRWPFASSSAQQYAWLQERYPERFERVRARVKEGRFVPVGDIWVESDANMVGGEALVRQFVQGKRFFIEQLGIEDRDGRLASRTSSATPVRSRRWRAWPAARTSSPRRCRGTTPTRCRTTPSGGRASTGRASSRTSRRSTPTITTSRPRARPTPTAASQRRARASVSLAPFGYGDGGGGPTREMIAAARRAADLEGSPRVVLSDPDSFFEAARGVADPAHLDGRALPGVPPRHLHHAVADQAGQPAQRAPAARGRSAAGPQLPPCARASSTPTTIWSAPGARCCSSSSTTSCRARRSLGAPRGRAALRRGGAGAGGGCDSWNAGGPGTTRHAA